MATAASEGGGASTPEAVAAHYTPQNILITGGAGFIASHLVILLVEKYPQYNIVVFDRLDYCACLENLECIAQKPNYKFVKGNICSSDMVTYILREEKIDTILHFAAQTHVDNSFGNSFQFTQNNIYGTHVLLESAKKVGIKRFVHVSTDEVYGEGEHDQEPMFEDNVLEPTNPYAATKAGAEFIAKAYFRSFNLPVIITRGNNVYGPHQYPEKLIPKFINQLMRGKKLTIHGTGSNKRNFLHVADVATAFEKILHAGVEGSIYNIGGTNEHSVLKVARDLMRIFELPVEDGDKVTEFGDDRVFNDLRYTINSDKLAALGWKEEKTWEQGLKETVEWYRTNSSRFGDIEHCLVAHPRAGLGQEESSSVV